MPPQMSFSRIGVNYRPRPRSGPTLVLDRRATATAPKPAVLVLRTSPVRKHRTRTSSTSSTSTSTSSVPGARTSPVFTPEYYRHADHFGKIVAAFGPEVNEAVAAQDPHDPIVQNVVVSGGFGVRIQNSHVSAECPYVEFKDTFAAATCRHTDPSATAQVFPSGNYVSVGGSSFAMTLTAIQRVRLALERIGYRTQMKPVMLCNEVYRASVPFRLSVSRFAADPRNQWRCAYKPKRYPGAILHMQVDGQTCAVELFDTGKYVFMGLCGLETCKRANEILKPSIVRVRDDSTPDTGPQRNAHRKREQKALRLTQKDVEPQDVVDQMMRFCGRDGSFNFDPEEFADSVLKRSDGSTSSLSSSSSSSSISSSSSSSSSKENHTPDAFDLERECEEEAYA